MVHSCACVLVVASIICCAALSSILDPADHSSWRLAGTLVATAAISNTPAALMSPRPQHQGSEWSVACRWLWLDTGSADGNGLVYPTTYDSEKQLSFL